MDNNKLVRKLYAYRQDPDLYKAPSNEDLADLVILVLNAVKTIETSIEQKRVDVEAKYDKQASQVLARTEKDAETLMREVRQEVNRLIADGFDVLNQTQSQLESRVQQAINNIRNGNDGIVTEEEIQRAASIAFSMLELPDFDSLVMTQITSNGQAIRDALELLQGDERYKVEIADVQGLEKALNDLAQIRSAQGGTIGKNQVYNFIRQAIADGTISSGGSVSDEAYGGSWDGVTDEAPSKNAVYDKIQALSLGAGTGDVVGPTSAVDSRLAAFDGTTGKLLKDAGVTASSFATAAQGALADSASQPGHTHTAANITDFDTAVAANSTVAANTSKLAGIETGADVTDATNVAAAGAIMDDDFSTDGLMKRTGAGTYATATAGTDYIATETDPVVGAVSGIVKANGLGTISAAVAGTDYLAPAAIGSTVQAYDANLPTWPATVDATEVGYLNGVTGAIQTQINAKAPIASPTFTGTVTLPTGLTGVIRADSGVVSVDTDVTDIVTAASDTAAGKVELATDAETVTGTDTSRATTPANITARLAAPGTIGGTTPGAATFTTVTTTGNIELGNASDTTISRTGAGQIAVEGVQVVTASNTVTETNKTFTAPKLTVSNLSNLGATEAIDWSAADIFYGTLDSNVTITHTNEASGRTITLHLAYDATAQRTITWSDVDRWTDNSSGAAPTTPSASGQVLTVTMQYYGTTCVASATGNYSVYA